MGGFVTITSDFAAGSFSGYFQIVLIVIELVKLFGGPDIEGIIFQQVRDIIGPIADDILNPYDLLQSLMQGTPAPEKTLEIGQRLVTSEVRELRQLGSHFIAGAAQEHFYITDPTQAESWFNPAIRLTVQRLGLQNEFTLRSMLDSIISQGEQPTDFDRAYNRQLFKPRREVTEWDFIRQWPDSVIPRLLLHETSQGLGHDIIEIPPMQNPPPPPPPPTDCTDPCELAVINQLQGIAIQINAGNGILTVLAQNLPALLEALRNLANPAVAVQVAKLVDCVCPNLDAITKSLEGAPGSPLASIVDALNKLAGGDRADNPDLKRIADSFAAADEKEPGVRAVLEGLSAQGLIDPQLLQAYGL